MSDIGLGVYKLKRKKVNFLWGNWSVDVELIFIVCCYLMKKE